MVTSKLETLQKHGTEVYRYTWDHGTPFVGAHTDVVYYYRGRYYASFSYDGRLVGPLGSLMDALAEGLLGVNSSTTAIWSAELPRAELIRRLVIYDDAAGRVIEVNDKPWRVPRKRITIAVIRTRLERWKATSTEVSNREPSSYASFIATKMAGGDVRRLEEALTRISRAPTWKNVVQELTGLRMYSSELDTKRKQLLVEIAGDR